ncbi:sulfatase-like hydrolase/transferase [Chelativorans sp. AA-79]|uniref:sulfatase-like hydrolase/transferase n=1 Tax=Chelativorans sp. AA-79 TaxID=3028735 RepID=UPI0023F8D7AB|nr:sulfatase-like hydrolase/transferase [Chelativorans sp. AA-79]WEX12158.1 sulfatase-like hydrolase/transferase [Chelativorans sp. AA-79]
MARNVLIIMSDEHSRKVVGCYDNRKVHTPRIDALAAGGTRFANAYCNSPICVPSRASFHTGYYPHQIRYWDNATPYDGRVPSWGHALRDAGLLVTSIGKLHFANAECDTGFETQLLPLHVKDGVGDISSLLRKDPMERPGSKKLPDMVGQEVTPYWNYDRQVADAAVDWLDNARPDGPWVTMISFALPHFPLSAPARFREMYDRDKLPLPKAGSDYVPENRSLADMRALMNYQDYFENEAHILEALAHYYALCSALDENIGRVLNALAASTAAEDTSVIYISDHGDNLGARGFWAKSTLWEESVGVPLVVAGPGIPAGRVCDTPVSLVDLYPTILDLAGLSDQEVLGPPRPGISLLDILHAGDLRRAVFAEYHAVGSKTASYMLRSDNFKLIEYVDDAPLLYDVGEDPEEMTNLAKTPAYSLVLEELRAKLRTILDPEKTNTVAFADQARRVSELGGEAAIRKMTPVTFTEPG